MASVLDSETADEMREAIDEADVEGEPVLIRNVDDFENLGFEVETY